MNPGPAAERVLEALRRQITEHDLRPGERLDPAIIASQLSTSVTPVRDALNRLTGEGLVAARIGGGFAMPQIDEPLLHDLYQWNEQVLLLALAGWLRGSPQASDSHGEARTQPERTAALFAAIASRSANSLHLTTIETLNSRLHAIRRAEGAVMALDSEDFDPWIAAISQLDQHAIRTLVLKYHRRRHRHASAILRAIHRG